MPRSPSLLLDGRPWRLPLALVLALPWLAWACGGGSHAAPDAGSDAGSLDTLAPESAPDALDAPDPDGLTETDTATDLPPERAWSLTPVPAAEPATDAWLRVVVRTLDEDSGRLSLAVEAGAFADLFGLALGLAFDPALATVVEVRAPEALPEPAGASWGVLWRDEPGRVVAGLALRRSDDPLFGEGAKPTVSLPAGTPLLEIDLQMDAPGDLTLGWLPAETAVVGTDLLGRAVETLDLVVKARKGGAR